MSKRENGSDMEEIPEVSFLLQKAKQAFLEKFGREARFGGVAPGRVNLIGDHVDYNDGFVLPMALPLVTVIVGDTKPSPGMNCVWTLSEGVDEPKEVEFSAKPTPGKLSWANYVKGVVANFESEKTPPFEAVVITSVPLGGGVSSSASLEVAVYMFLTALTSQLKTVDLKKVAKACQTAEHQFANMPCGIMDQMVSCMAKPGTALLLDCRSLETEYVPLDDPNVVVLITNSNVRHTLTGSEYPSRRLCCEKSAKFFDVKSLRDLDLKTLETASGKVDPETFRRSRHVVTEIQRTQEAGEALKKRDYRLFGKLMNESHASLRDDFEVSCPEIDQLVALAQSVEEVFGSRITGGGFGGCTVTLVKRDAVKKTVDVIRNGFQGNPTFYVCQPSSGCYGIEF